MKFSDYIYYFKKNHSRKLLTLVILIAFTTLSIWKMVIQNSHSSVPEVLTEEDVLVLVRLNPKNLNYDPNTVIVEIANQSNKDLQLRNLILETPRHISFNASLLFDSNNNSTPDFEDQTLGALIAGATNQWETTLRGSLGIIPAQTNLARFFIKTEGDYEIGSLLFEFLEKSTSRQFNPVYVRFIDDGTNRYRRDVAISPEEFILKYPQFRLASNTIYLGPGRFDFNQNIIIPTTVDRLVIMPGTTLAFLPSVSLVSYSPIEAVGKFQQPIIFTSATNLFWGALGVIDTKQKESTFEYVTVEKAGPAKVNGISLSGGLSAYYANIRITNSTFKDNHGDDGVNIKNSKARVANNRFLINEFDGLDLDVVLGEISDNLFELNGNDGLDISFNQAIIERNTSRSNGDKCLSVGELSTAPIRENIFQDCPIGIAVKDGADVLISSNKIEDNNQGILIYTKKPYFESNPKVTLQQNMFNNNYEDVFKGRTGEITSD